MVYVDPLKLQANELSPDGCGARHRRIQPDSARRRRPHRPARLQPLHQRASPEREGAERRSAENRRARNPSSFPMWATPWTAPRCSTTSCASMASAPSTSRFRSKAATATPSRSSTASRGAIKTLRDIPSQLKTHVVFDQSLFVKQAISTVLREGGIGLVLTALMVLVFLGSPRATVAVFLSIPLSVMATFFRPSHRQRDDQQHDPQRPGAGVFAADRQLRDRARKHLPPHRARRRARWSRPKKAPTKSAWRCWRSPSSPSSCFSRSRCSTASASSSSPRSR